MTDEQLSLTLVLLLTLGTGTVDAVSYFSLDHVFTANMSGNMALLGIGAATSLGDVAGNIYAFLGFVIGSVAVGRLIRFHPGPTHRTTVDVLGAQLVLMVALTLIVAFVDVSEHDFWRYVVCGMLAAAMGIQTGVARHLAVKDVNTTVATMTLHDLAAASRPAGGDSVRWGRRATVVLALFVGAAIGVLLDDQVRWGGLCFSSVVVALVMALALAVLRRDRRSPDEGSAGAGL